MIAVFFKDYEIKRIEEVKEGFDLEPLCIGKWCDKIIFTETPDLLKINEWKKKR